MLAAFVKHELWSEQILTPRSSNCPEQLVDPWLREKIESDPSNPKFVQTVRGFGYRLGG